MLRDSLPRGYRRASSATGLLIPEQTPRQREVWTRDESRLQDRAIALWQSRSIKQLIQCANPECPSPTIERIKGTGQEYILRCGCKDRVHVRAF